MRPIVVTFFIAWLNHSVSCLIEITNEVVSQSLSSLCTPKHLHFNLNMLNSVTWFLFRPVLSSYDCSLQETYTMECPNPISPAPGFMAWVRAKKDSLEVVYIPNGAAGCAVWQTKEGLAGHFNETMTPSFYIHTTEQAVTTNHTNDLRLPREKLTQEIAKISFQVFRTGRITAPIQSSLGCHLCRLVV